MSDQLLIDLAPGWSLGFDNLQWIIYRVYFKRDTARLLPVSFIGSTKTVLRRVIQENGIQLTPEAVEYIDAMPGTFRVWFRQHGLRVVPEEREAA